MIDLGIPGEVDYYREIPTPGDLGLPGAPGERGPPGDPGSRGLKGPPGKYTHRNALTYAVFSLFQSNAGGFSSFFYLSEKHTQAITQLVREHLVTKSVGLSSCKKVIQS